MSAVSSLIRSIGNGGEHTRYQHAGSKGSSGSGFCGRCPRPAALPCVRTLCRQKSRCRRESYNNLFHTVCVCFRDSFFLPGIELREDGRVCFICRPPGQRTLSGDFVISLKQNLLSFLFKKRSDDRYLVCVFRSARHYRRQSERE